MTSECDLRGVVQFNCLSIHDNVAICCLCCDAAEVPHIADDVAMATWSSGWWCPNDGGPWSCGRGLASTSPAADQYVPTPAPAAGPNT